MPKIALVVAALATVIASDAAADPASKWPATGICVPPVDVDSKIPCVRISPTDAAAIKTALVSFLGRYHRDLSVARNAANKPISYGYVGLYSVHAGVVHGVSVVELLSARPRSTNALDEMFDWTWVALRRYGAT